jgi:hypothetical protein
MQWVAVDYSTPIPGADLVAAGINVVFRYITDPVWPKSLTESEVSDLRAHGIRIELLDEQTADYMLGGYGAGFQRAQQRRARALALGFPRYQPIFYSLDLQAEGAQISEALEFLAGCSQADGGIGGVGAYGEYAFVKSCADAGYLTVGTDAWSSGLRDPRAIAWQTGGQRVVAGVPVDRELDLNPSYFPSSTTPTPPTSSTGDNAMPAFVTGTVTPGADAVTVVLPPPAELGSAGWGNVWFSLGTDFQDGDVRVAIFTHGAGWSEIDQDIHVPAAGDRVNPHGGPLPTGVQKISIRRTGPNVDAPMAYLIEATAR